MYRSFVPLAFVMLLWAPFSSVTADAGRPCVIDARGPHNALAAAGTGEPSDASARTAHEWLGEAAIASPERYPLGAMLLRSAALSTTLSSQSSTVDLQLTRLQLLLYSDACARDMQRRLSARPKGYIRLPITLDPVALQRDAGSAQPLLEGDLLFLPPIPTAVLVVGAIESPGAVAYRPNTDARDYILAAGGWARGADRSETFVYLPDGQRRPIRAAFWNYEPRHLPPGSVIVVPGRGVDLARQVEQLVKPSAAAHQQEQPLPTLRMEGTFRHRSPREPDSSTR